jgi:hypothetical protein
LDEKLDAAVGERMQRAPTATLLYLVHG